MPRHLLEFSLLAVFTFALPWAQLVAAEENDKRIQELLESVRKEAYAKLHPVAEELGKLGADAVPALRKHLAAPHRLVREAVVRAMEHMGPAAKEGVPDLIKCLKDEIPRIRERAAAALEAVGKEALPALDALVAALEDADEEVVMQVADALTAIGPESKPALMAILKKPKNKQQCNGAIRALYHLKPADEALVAELMRIALHNKDEDLRMEALNALGEIGPDAATTVPHLIGMLEKEPKLRWRVAFTLDMIGPKAKAALPALRRIMDNEKEEALAAEHASAAVISIINGVEAQTKP